MPIRITYLLVFAAVLLLQGCGLFDTRDAEAPNTGGSHFVPPTSPDIVIDNLEQAISEKNTENYMRCLPDTLSSDTRFVFIPTAAAAGRYPTSFLNWSLQSERSYFSALKAFTDPNSSSSLHLEGGFSVLAADSAIYEADYTVIFRHGVSDVPESVSGNLQFVLRPDRNFFWSITRWIDNPVSGNPSWSEWKGRFAN